MRVKWRLRIFLWEWELTFKANSLQTWGWGGSTDPETVENLAAHPKGRTANWDQEERVGPPLFLLSFFILSSPSLGSFYSSSLSSESFCLMTKRLIQRFWIQSTPIQLKGMGLICCCLSLSIIGMESRGDSKKSCRRYNRTWWLIRYGKKRKIRDNADPMILSLVTRTISKRETGLRKSNKL